MRGPIVRRSVVVEFVDLLATLRTSRFGSDPAAAVQRWELTLPLSRCCGRTQVALPCGTSVSGLGPGFELSAAIGNPRVS